jgi:hypothetical protein
VEKEMREVIRQAEVFSMAVRQIRESPALRGILAVILKLGNFLNGGSARGGAYVFKIEFLAKLKDIRSTEPGFTFMHLIAKIVDKTMPPLAGILDELDQVITASTVDLEHAKEIAMKHRTLLAECNKRAKDMSMLMVDDGLPKFAEEYVALATPLCLEFDAKCAEGQSSFEELKKLYGEDAMTADEFFHIFATFLQHYNQALNDNRDRDAKKKK